jgi:hypothetical protein
VGVKEKKKQICNKTTAFRKIIIKSQNETSKHADEALFNVLNLVRSRNEKQ